MGVLLGLHLLATVVWVGGMFFAYICLRPVAADVLEPPQRLLLWAGVFERFFSWVWGAVCLLLVSGHSMVALLGGMAEVAVHIHLMMLWGYPMVLLFGYLYFWPYLSYKRLVAEQRWSDAAKQLNRIRKVVAINLCLGLVVVLLGSAGRFLF